jgi:hypothetical protein
MTSIAVCPYCSRPLVNVADIPNYQVEELATGLHGDNKPAAFWTVSCSDCKRLLGILPHAPTRVEIRRR